MATCIDDFEDPINIFSTGAGKVIAVAQTAIPLAIAVDGDQRLFNDLTAIITAIGIRSQGGFQFMHALREFIYVYVFTERVGEIVISGLAFPDSCNQLGPQDNDDFESPAGCGITGQTGLERIIQWYECNRITTRASPVVIALGSDVSYDAFLVGMKADIADASTGIAQFTMNFNFIPNTAELDDFCFPLDEDCLTGTPCGAQA